MKQGFSLIEILIIIGLATVIATIGFLNIYGFRSESELDLTVKEIISVLRNAQNQSMSQEDSVQWGVYFDNPLGSDGYYLLYKGATTTVTSKKMLRSNIQFLNPIQNDNKNILFSFLTGTPIINGLPNSSTTITVALKNNVLKNKTIIIASNGLVSLDASFSSSSWNSLSLTLSPVSMGGALTSVGADTIYALRGSDYSNFWIYTISTNSWQSLSNVPGDVSVGVDGDLVAVNNYVYALRPADAGQDNFWRYNISTGNWENLNDIPNAGGLYYSMALTAIGNDIYANKGTSSNNFYKYNVSTGSWTQLVNSLTVMDNGGDLTAVGNNEIYMTRGGASRNFYKYTISSNSWSSVADAPANIYWGGSLTTVGTDIYALRGDLLIDFWKYNTLTNAWSNIVNVLADVGEGASLTTVDGNAIYALRGDYKTDFWRYDILN